MANEGNLKPFKKGDTRINRRGRPKNFDGLRALARDIANEGLTSADGAVTMTTIEAILRKWASSNNAQLQRQFVEVAFGKVPDELDITSGSKPINPYMGLTDEQLVELARRIANDNSTSED